MAAKLYDTIRMSRYYNGPVSDHFDGARFFDPHGAPPRSQRDLLRWFVDRHWRATKSKWPAWAPSPYADRPPARIDGAAWRISYVGHASWLIQTAGFNMLLDPVWSKRASPFRFAGPQRVNDPGVAFADLPPSMSCWYRTATTIISISLLCRGWQPRIAHASLRRSAMTPSCEITILQSGPKPTTGRIGWTSARELR